MRIIIARHGKTKWNDEGRHQGLLDSPLTEDGRKEVREFARSLLGEEIQCIFCSNLGRAVDTAKEIAAILSVPMHVRNELREISFGILDGEIKKEMKLKYPELVSKREADRYGFRYPGGECYADVVKRITPFLAELKLKHANDTILIVAHEATNKTLIGTMLGLPSAEMVRMAQPHGCVYVVELRGEGTSISITRDGKKEAGYLMEDGTLKSPFNSAEFK